MIEVWKDIPGYEGCFQASDQGRIRSLDRYVPTKSRAGLWTERFIAGQIIKPHKRKDHYYTLCLARKPFTVHRLVAITFLGPRPEGFEVAHKDGDRANCKLENLRYSTHLDNLADMELHGTRHRGEKNYRAKLTEADIKEIRRRAGSVFQRDLADEFGVGQATIWKIIHRERWAHVV